MKFSIQESIVQLAFVGMFATCLGACTSRSDDASVPVAVVADGVMLRVPRSSPLRAQLQVQAVQSKDAPHALAVPATVEADPARTLPILPPVTGRVIALKVGLGDRVARGQTLLVIASGDSAQAYTDVDKARDALNLAKKQRDRAHAVNGAGGAAAKDLEAAQSAYAQAQAEFNRAEMRLKTLGGSTDLQESDRQGSARQIRVAAPVDGTITTLATAAGAYINDATAATMTLSNLDRIWVTANVPEDEIAGIANGQKVDVALAAYPGETLHGNVQFVDAVLAPDTRRERVRIAFANTDGKLKPNMFATATFLLPQPVQVFVPQSAILMNNDSTTVFVEVAPWTFERRAVELGYDEGDAARVLKGLKSGDRVLVKGGVLIND